MEDTSVLNEIVITHTKIEKITERHKTSWIKQWTLYDIEVDENIVDDITQKISTALDSKHDHSWYADFCNDDFHYIIFRNKIFKIDRTKADQYQEVSDYGINLGIPDYQLNFSKFIKNKKYNFKKRTAKFEN